MSGTLFRLVFLALAGCIVPIAYITLCVSMYRQRVWWFAYLAYFVIFGAFGGWCFAFAMSPSGLAAMSVLFLATVVLPASIISALILQFRKQKSRLERIAMMGAYAYPLLVAAYLVFSVVFYHPFG